MQNQTQKRFFFDSIKTIRMPVFQLIFYSSLGYLGYCFYQDYRYKQLLQQINARSNKQSAISPLKRITQIVNKIQAIEGKRQLKTLLKDLELGVEKYWIDPRKRENLIDFQVKQIQKSQQEKKIWWMTPYTIYAKMLLSIYHRSDVMKQGIFGLFFWSNYKVQQKNQILEIKSINTLINKAINLRLSKCQQFTLNNKSGGFQNEDREIYQCLAQTSKQISTLSKMMSRLETIGQKQLLR